MAGGTEVFKIEIDGLDQLNQLKKAWADIKKNKSIKLDLEGKSTAGKGAALFSYWAQRQKQMMGEEVKNLMTMRKSIASHFVGGIKLFGATLKRWSLWAVGAISGFAFWGLRMAKEVRQQVLAGRFMGESAVNIRRANYAMEQSGIGLGDSSGEDVFSRISKAKALPQEAEFRSLSGVTSWESKTPSQIFSEMLKNMIGMNPIIKEKVASHFGLDFQRVTPESVAKYESEYAKAPANTEGQLNAMAKMAEWWRKFQESMGTRGIAIMAKFAPLLETMVNALDRGAQKITSYLLSAEFSNDLRRIGEMFRYFAVKMAGLLEALGMKNYAPKEWRKEVASIEAIDEFEKARKGNVGTTISEMRKNQALRDNPESIIGWIEGKGNSINREVAVREYNARQREAAKPGQSYMTLLIKADNSITTKLVQSNVHTGNTPLNVETAR